MMLIVAVTIILLTQPVEDCLAPANIQDNNKDDNDHVEWYQKNKMRSIVHPLKYKWKHISFLSSMDSILFPEKRWVNTCKRGKLE